MVCGDPSGALYYIKTQLNTKVGTWKVGDFAILVQDGVKHKYAYSANGNFLFVSSEPASGGGFVGGGSGGGGSSGGGGNGGGYAGAGCYGNCGVGGGGSVKIIDLPPFKEP